MGETMKVIAGPSSQVLGVRLSRELSCPLVEMEYRRFPDGEQYCRIKNGVPDHAVLVQGTPTDGDFTSLLFLLDALDGADRIDLVVPYFGYSRQDRRFLDGEPISARAIARCLNADRTILVNTHATGISEHFPGEVNVLDAAPLLAEHVRDWGKDVILLAPDKGAFNMVKGAAEHAGLDFDHLEKTRLSGDDVTIAPRNLAVKGRDVVILDDMISTGGSIATAAEMILEQGANNVHAIAVHGVLAGAAVLRMAAAGVDMLAFTDTLECAHSKVSVAPLIAGALKP